ncbi:MAG: type II secretion system protein [Patescibacteria group bacterium]
MSKQNGFTLIEYLIYVAIVAIFLLSATVIMLVLMSGKSRIEAVEEVERNGRAAMQTIMTRTINASSVTLPAAGTTSSFLIIVASGTTSTFGVRDGVLEIKEGASASSSLTSSGVTISDLVFRNLALAGDPATIHLEFTVSSTNPSANPDFDYGQIYRGSAAIRTSL